jgi:hypothetical protein
MLVISETQITQNDFGRWGGVAGVFGLRVNLLILDRENRDTLSTQQANGLFVIPYPDPADQNQCGSGQDPQLCSLPFKPIPISL